MIAFCLVLLFVLLLMFMFLVEILLFLSSVSLPGDDALCWLFSCPFFFCLLSLLF